MLVRAELGWFLVCVAGWLLISLIGGESQAECDARGDFLCFSRADMLVIVGIFGALFWFGGALLIALCYALDRWLRRHFRRRREVH
jgi:hypothetical protein